MIATVAVECWFVLVLQELEQTSKGRCTDWGDTGVIIIHNEEILDPLVSLQLFKARAERERQSKSPNYSCAFAEKNPYTIAESWLSVQTGRLCKEMRPLVRQYVCA